MNGRRRAAGLGLAAMMLAGVVFATPAAADDCPPLEPTCVVETVDEVVDDTTETVDEVTDAAEDVVDEVVTTVDDTVGDPTGGSDPGPDENGGGGGGGDRGVGGIGGDVRVRPHRGVAPAGLPRSSVVLPAAGIVPRAPDPQASGGPVTGSAAVPVATGLALLSFLLAVMIGFVSFQHVVDRGDPKLAPETLAPDLVPFA
jgi:hypothetical protein